MPIDIRYVTAGPWGAGEGTPHTPAQADENLYNLAQAAEDLEANPTQPYQISNVSQIGNLIYFHLSDSVTVLGPVTLPTSTPPVVVAVTATSLSPTLGQANCYFRCTNNSGCVATLPTNAEIAFPIGTELHFVHRGVIGITFDWSSSMTVNVPDGFLASTSVVGAVITAKKVDDDEWDIFGLLEAA